MYKKKACALVRPTRIERSVYRLNALPLSCDLKKKNSEGILED